MKYFSLTHTVKVSVSAIALTSLLAADAAYAQDNDEIIVTARKQETTLQDTPVAISTFDTEAIQAAGFQDIIDISKATPGLFIEPISDRNARVNTNPRFRGITVDNSSPLLRTASVFIDGVYVAGGIQGLGAREVERVEVIKGPQSAIFGRNTFAGAINYVTKRPGEEFSGEFSALAATRDEYRVSGGVEGSIIGDVLTARVNASYDFDGGHYDNSFNSATDVRALGFSFATFTFEEVDPAPELLVDEEQELGEETTWSIGSTFAFQPNDRFNARFRATYYEDKDGPAAVARVGGTAAHNFGGFDQPGGGTTETAFRGTLIAPDTVGASTTQNIYDVSVGAPLAAQGEFQDLGISFEDLGGPGLKREALRLMFDASYDLNDNVTFDVLAGFNKEDFLYYIDFDSMPDLSFNTVGGRDTEDFSLEGRLSGTAFDDRLIWSFGANYLDIEIVGVGGFYDGLRNVWFSGIAGAPASTGAKTVAAFGSLEYEITDKFTAIFEGRYQEDEISEDGVNEGLATPISPGKFKNFLPRFLLQYEPSIDTTLYANYSLGNLPGGFNPEVAELIPTQLAEFQGINPGVTSTFGEESLANYELGWKQKLFDGDAGFNLAAFYMKRSDQIFSGFTFISEDPALTAINGNETRSVAFTGNGATTNIYGFELDSMVKASDYLTLEGSLAYIDAKISSYPEGAGAGDFTDVFGAGTDPSGQVAPRFPAWTGSLSGTYMRPFETGFLGADADWFLRGDLYYTGEFYDSNTNLAETPSAVDANLRTGIKRDNIRFELFVTNLFDEDAPIGANNIADTSFDTRLAPGGAFDFSKESIHLALRDRRQFGARIDYTF